MGDPAAHAKLSPSAAERWMNCPGSIALSAKAPRGKTSIHAAEGTVAHTVSEQLASGALSLPQVIERIGEVVMQDGYEITITEEMVEGAEEYQELGLKLKAGLNRPAKVVDVVEEKVHASIPQAGRDLWGTADRLIYQPGNHLYVIDYKYGKGVAVEVERNPQLMIYGLAAMDTVAGKAFEKVTLVIHQPRAFHADGPVRMWTTTVAELEKWRLAVGEAAGACLAPDAPCNPGDWCRWCPASGVEVKGGGFLCQAEYRQIKEVTLADFEVDSPENPPMPEVDALSQDQVALALKWRGAVESWFKRVADRAMERALAGEDIAGFKLVEGRSRRTVSDAESIAADLTMLHGEDAVYEKKLVGLGKLEKLAGKKKVAEYVANGWITKPPGALSLVPMSDKREALPPAGSSKDDFDEVPTPAVSGGGLFAGLDQGEESKTVWPQN